MTRNLTIVILTYNSSHIILECLSKIDPTKNHVVIVDNASKDNTVDLIRAHFPQIELIQNQKNVGYGRGNNVALNKVDTDYALILNPDALIEEESIKEMLDVMENNQNIAIASPLILRQYPLSQEEFNQKLDWVQKNHHKISNDIYLAKLVVGCSMFLRMSVFRKIGFFDENIFLYYEDDKICFKSKKNGFLNVIVTSAVSFHKEGTSSQTKPTFRSTFRKNWHLKGWSKLYWKQIRSGKFKAKVLAVKLCISGLIWGISYAPFNRIKSAEYLGSSLGSLHYLLGFSAFKNDGTPRG